MASFRLTAQEIQNFTGHYMIQEVCTSGTIPNYSDTLAYEIEIKPSSVDTFDIQFNLEAHFPDTIRAKVLNDSTFQITLQEFTNYDRTSLFITGDGKVVSDSIKIDYSAGGAIGSFQCSCKGIKKKETGITGTTEDKFKIRAFPNPVQDELTITLENDNHSTFELQLFDLTGKLIRKQKVSSNQIVLPVQSLQKGLYFYKLIDQQTMKFSTGKFVKE